MSTPVCHRCSSPLQRASFNQPGVHTFGRRMPEMYLGVVCQDCGRVECNRCKGSPADGPCSRCRGPVQPAWEHLFSGGIDLSAFGPSTSAEPLPPWWKVLPGVVIGVVVIGFLAWGVWDLYRADPPYLTGPEKVHSLAVSADGRRAAAGAGDRALHFYDLDGGRETRGILAHDGDVKWLTFHPDGRHVFSAGSHIDTLKQWDGETGQLVRQYGLPSAENDRALAPPAPAGPAGPGAAPANVPAAFPPRPVGGVLGAGLTTDGARLLAADHRTIYTWDTARGTLLSSVARQEPPRPGADRTVVFSPNGRHAVVWFRASTSTPGASTLELLAVESGQVVRTLSGHAFSVQAVEFTPDGRQIVSVDRDTLRVWDAATGGLVSTWSKTSENDAGTCLAVSPDGRQVALGGSTGSMFFVGIPVYDLTTGQAQTLRGHKKSVRGLAFLRDGRLLSSGGDRGIRLWDVASGTQQRPR